MILDTPGIRELTLAHSREVLREMFSDIETLFLSCKFANCTHNLEPDCAIQKALQQKTLDKRRYNNYQKLCAEHLCYAQVIEENIKDNSDVNGRKKFKEGRGKNEPKSPPPEC